MKNKLLIFSILILCTSSCNYLEYDESDFLEKDAVFSAFILIEISRRARCSVCFNFGMTGFSLLKET